MAETFRKWIECVRT